MCWYVFWQIRNLSAHPSCSDHSVTEEGIWNHLSILQLPERVGGGRELASCPALNCGSCVERTYLFVLGHLVTFVVIRALAQDMLPVLASDIACVLAPASGIAMNTTILCY